MSTTETHTFQAEVRQVLDIVVHSLYKDRDIFVRELVSNASDSLEKLRHTQLVEKSLNDADLPLEITITTDEAAGTLTISDTGIGFTRDELVENIGTIAHSGTKAFLAALREKNTATSDTENLIGQFGVGFFSAFMVAENVTIHTRSWKPDSPALCWKSSGDGSYTISPLSDSEPQKRGAKIILQLKPEFKDFATKSRVKDILQRYSAYIPHPILVDTEHLNTIQPIWLKSKSEVTPEQYKEFYKFHCHAYEDPLDWFHFSADAPLLINSLLYIPSANSEKLGFSRMEAGVTLHCRKILIDNAPKTLLPEWLRFLRGVVDSADLPLNISRETLQDSAILTKLNRLLTKRFIKYLEELAKNDAARYNTFWREFSHFIKEGIVTDHNSREALAPLLRYESSFSVTETTIEPAEKSAEKSDEKESENSLEKKKNYTSLDAYVDRMLPNQKAIYYLTGPDRATLESGPYLEAFRARKLEVLYLYESADDYVISHLGTFKEHPLVSADQADLDLGDAPEDSSEKSKLVAPLEPARAEALCEWLKTELSADPANHVESVSTGKRLVESPVATLNADKFLTPSMRRLMQSMSPDSAPAAPTVKLEINPRHPLIHSLDSLRTDNPALAKLIAAQLLDTALLSAGMLDNPRTMSARLFQILESAAKK